MSTILVIEDEPQVQANICEILELADYTTLAAADGMSGVELAKQQAPDLIICDVMMPRLDGYGVITELRQHPETANTPFIFLTARSEQDALRQGMQLGADDYLRKPFSPEDLLEAVSVRLNKHLGLVDRFNQQLEQAKEAAQFLQHYDRDTGLPNYQLLEKHFDLAKIYAQQQTVSLAVLVVELDQLEHISATLGHRMRKLLLESFAQRLMAFSAALPSLEVIAYLGGRQFAMLSRPAMGQAQIAELAGSLLQELRKPFLVAGQEIFVKPTIGISLYPENGEVLDRLLGCAEGAIYKGNKYKGDKPLDVGFYFYTPQHHVRALERLTLESKLHHALENDELQVFYQPQVELASQRLIAAEALIRWYLPERGYISPIELISIAEETGLIIPIGEWVLETACRQACYWQQALAKSLTISVNLSARQFHQPDLTGQVESVLQRTGLAPQGLVLEVTESSILEDTQKALSTLEDLKALGIEVAIDDFGTGYSSLSCLKQFPFDVLKIDQSFIRNIHQNPGNIPITRIIIQLAKELNLDLIAEGIETEQELNFLLSHGCQMGQGYLFGRPVSALEFNQFFLPVK
ncbi:EAL domain-containing protein [Pseudanabaena sp. FACHB-2040]|uniref:putative bifunctional diguanylate cyclase/phosphodiesterase n=1 Tax=Pseudanabaena sp. FACHB-2040 TaxID=2692859 RepID=UPI001683EBF4|nr:EAL domain-containing protein [Pseudanabaena sp. FACHB-2040]MBD2257646.1 EAL domain-containing protein [Pseudanabaena sp. FACHB-2040]